MQESTEPVNTSPLTPPKASRGLPKGEALLLTGLAIFSFGAVMLIPADPNAEIKSHNSPARQAALLNAVKTDQIFGLTVADILTKFGEPDTQAVSKKDGLTVMTYGCPTGAKNQPWINFTVQGGKVFAVWPSTTAEEGAKAIEKADRSL